MFPLSVVAGCAMRFRVRTFRVVFVAGTISSVCICAIFSLSAEPEFAWHLESVERLLWIPAILIMREIASVETCVGQVAKGFVEIN